MDWPSQKLVLRCIGNSRKCSTQVNWSLSACDNSSVTNMTCHPLHFVCEHVCLYVSSAVFPWWVHNSSVLFLSHHVHLHVFFSVVYKPTVRRLCFQVMLFKWQKCPSQSAKAASVLSYLNWDHELVSSNKVHPYEKTIESFSLHFPMFPNNILHVLYLPCSSIHDFDGDNQVYIKSACVDLNHSGHTGFTW